MPVVYKNKKKTFCIFCMKDCKILMIGQYVCPNGHYLFHRNGEVEELQPKSVGTRIEGHNVYRFESLFGCFCNREGGTI